ncbi:MAG: biopolymer transporter ExbD [Bacteroides sp.]|nr:biopolymer transporter ExbD [Bacteroides sp.]
MALKRNFRQLDTFSMSSMTDVIFLLLIFFMVTSTIIFPGAIDVNLPQGTEQSSEKPSTQIYLTADRKLYVVDPEPGALPEETEPVAVTVPELEARLAARAASDSLRSMALYADSLADYGMVVRLLDMAARRKLRLVLSTSLSGVPLPSSDNAPSNSGGQ